MPASTHQDSFDSDVDATANLELQCLASTGDEGHGRLTSSADSLTATRCHGGNNFYKDAKFSADGTCIVTHSDDQSIRTFVLPPDLLDVTNRPHQLSSQSSLESPTLVQSYDLYPSFNLQDSSTTLILSSATDLPLRLTNALDASYVHAKYPHVNPTTEAWIAPNSLTFSHGGSQFIAGSQGLIAVFDTAYDGAGPIVTRKTKPRSAALAAHSMHDSSKIMALSLSPDGFLAAGSSGRSVGLYSSFGHGQCETSFSLAPEIGDKTARTGSGVTSLHWTPDGLYLLVAERQSDGIHVYDVRNQLRRLAWLSGRKANTTQRLGFDIVPTTDGCEVWAGGTDGRVRMWKNPAMVQGDQKPDFEVKIHEGAVPSAVWHPGGEVLATCSGQRAAANVSVNADDGSSSSDDTASESSRTPADEHDAVHVAPANNASLSFADNKLKVWSI